MCEETMYSFSGKMISDVMKHVHKVPTEFGVHCSVVRISSNDKEFYIAAVSGPEDKRHKACTSFEELFDKLKTQARLELHDDKMMVPKVKTYAPKEAMELKSTQLGPREYYNKFV